MVSELERLLDESRNLQQRYLEEYNELIQRWSNLVNEYRLMIESWTSSGSQSRDQIDTINMKRQGIRSIVGEHTDWLNKYSGEQREIQQKIAEAQRKDEADQLLVYQEVRQSITRNLYEDLFHMRKIVERFEDSVAGLRGYIDGERAP
jgi:hypothetical protein